MRLKVTGRDYATRQQWCCSECSRTIGQLVSAKVVPAFLRLCGNLDCGKLLCFECRDTHEMVHALAGEAVYDRWQPKSLQRRY